MTAFLVTPDMPGFKVVEARMPKVGIRGTATARLAFENMRVPAANILGPLGKGLKVALTVLDFGRTLAEFELVQKKLARMAAWTYAMEAMTTITASLIDRGLEDYMLETAMLKVYSTEVLWTMVNDAFQIHGGAAYFTDKPLERMLRDARINQIGEGANEVLTSFIALTGLRGPGLRLKSVADAARRPWSGWRIIGRFVWDQVAYRLQTPSVSVRSPSLRPAADELSRHIHRLGLAAQRTLFRHREEVVERQLDQERLAWIAMELFASACVLSRIESEIIESRLPADELDRRVKTASYFLSMSARRVDDELKALKHNDDVQLRAAGT